MARSKKYEKNLQKVQSYLDGDYKRKIQVGDASVGNVDSNDGHKVGDKWTDSDGYEWVQHNGYREKLRTLPNVGLFSKVCKDCESPCTKSYDVDTYKRMSRCYNCQVKFELDLQYLPENRIGENGNKWQFWVKLQALMKWETIDKEVEAYMEQKFEEDKKLYKDESVANAIANANITDTIKVNKKLTGG
tara:strand:- start:265 stop:831 length:567 start_codon:yes stop_codon:yes gene_type:complete